MLPRIAGGLRLRSKSAAESLAAGKFQHVIRDGRSFWTSFWSRFNVYIWHLYILSMMMQNNVCTPVGFKA